MSTTIIAVMNKIIERNNRIPCVVHQEFTTNEDNQPGVSVIIYEGERTMTRDNHKLGRFELMGIPPAPKGVPRIVIQFEIDSNGILQVTARDDQTGRSKSLVIKGESRLRDQDIKKMVEMSEKFREEDERKRDAVNAKNNLESYLFNVKNGMADLKEKLSEDDTKAINLVVQETFIWLDKVTSSTTAEELDGKYKHVNEIVGPAMRRLYGAADRHDEHSGGSEVHHGGTYYDSDDDERKAHQRGPRIEEVN
ncbi:hypothetical protein ACOME3_007518 [Neoechinorhynchus agilis]